MHTHKHKKNKQTSIFGHELYHMMMMMINRNSHTHTDWKCQKFFYFQPQTSSSSQMNEKKKLTRKKAKWKFSLVDGWYSLWLPNGEEKKFTMIIHHTLNKIEMKTTTTKKTRAIGTKNTERGSKKKPTATFSLSLYIYML